MVLYMRDTTWYESFSASIISIFCDRILSILHNGCGYAIDHTSQIRRVLVLLFFGQYLSVMPDKYGLAANYISFFVDFFGTLKLNNNHS
jgi:hypothetical protein